jgi:uncharacterized protein (DUF2342 family)
VPDPLRRCRDFERLAAAVRRRRTGNRNLGHPVFVSTTVDDMTDLPFGFGPGPGDPSQPGGNLPDDMANKVPLFAELQKLFSWSGGPVNWDLARQVALASLTASNAAVPAGEVSAVEDAVRLADLWLDDVTDIPSGISRTAVWNRVQWVEQTLPVWTTLCDPVAARVVAAMSTSLPEEVRAQAGPMAPIMNQLGGMMFGSQVGQALGGLAGEILSSTDIGLPLGPAEVRLYIALREAAHHRLFAHVPWLRQRLIDSVDAYARGITIDSSMLERAMSEIDPTNPESMQALLSGGMFEPEDTPGQQAALRRLETLLALVEGWVDAVTAEVAATRLGGGEALREASRRRRAGGGPAEQTFATLVGLELRPRKMREAVDLWVAAAAQRGQSGRDALWEHPDLMPDSDDLDDPVGFLLHSDDATDRSAEMDNALSELLDAESGDRPIDAEAAADGSPAGAGSGDGEPGGVANSDTVEGSESEPRDEDGPPSTPH